MRAAVCVMAAAACGSNTPQPALIGSPQVTGVPVLSEPGDRAYVADATGLLEVAPSGATQQVARAPISWCAADAKARVVWFVDKLGLQVFDLDDRKLYPIVLDNLDAIAVTIAYGRENLGAEEKLRTTNVGSIVVENADQPNLTWEVICHATHCFPGDELSDPDPDGRVRKRLDKLQLSDVAYLSAVGARAAAGSLWMPTTSTPPPVAPVIDKAHCGHATCGSLTQIQGSPLWLVVTAPDKNTRGSRSTRELWDPRSRTFVRPTMLGSLARIGELPPDYNPRTNKATDYAGLYSSKSGLLSHGGVVFTAEDAIFMPSDGGRSCGFAGGGWRR